MSAPTNHWKLGLFVLVGTVLTGTAAVYFGTRGLRTETVDYTSYFDESVTGLDVGSPVKFRGVTIGSVASIDIAPDRRLVAVRYELGVSELGRLGLAAGRGQHTTMPAPPDLRAQLGSTGLTGVKYILIDYFDPRTNPAPKLPFRVPSNCIPTAASTMKNIEDSLVKAVDEFPKLANDLSGVLQHVDALIVEVHGEQLPAKLNGVLVNADRSIALLHTKLEQVNSKEISSEALAAMTHLDSVMSKMQNVMERIDGERGVAASMQRATDNFGDMAATARGLGPDFGDTLRDVREAAEAVRRFAESLELDSDMLLKGRAKVAKP